jgi:hypothetical protein
MDDDFARVARPAGFPVAPFQLALAFDVHADAVIQQFYFWTIKKQNLRYKLKSGLQLRQMMALLQVKTDALRTLAAGCPGKTK